MARIRTIKPEFPQSESMGRLSRDARLLFIQLWTICDDSGKTRAASRFLANTLYPYDEDARELLEGWRKELEDEGCIVVYESGGNHYLQICKWHDHQKIDHPTPSKFPSFEKSSPILAKESERFVEEGTKDRDLNRDHEGLRDGIVEEIVCAHPKSVARKLEPSQVRVKDSTAVFEAIRAEVEAAGVGHQEAADGLLAIMRTFAEVIPREEWRFLKDVCEFFRSFDYRRDPSEFCRANGKPKEPTAVAPSAVENIAAQDWFRERALKKKAEGKPLTPIEQNLLGEANV